MRKFLLILSLLLLPSTLLAQQSGKATSKADAKKEAVAPAPKPFVAPWSDCKAYGQFISTLETELKAATSETDRAARKPALEKHKVLYTTHCGAAEPDKKCSVYAEKLEEYKKHDAMIATEVKARVEKLKNGKDAESAEAVEDKPSKESKTPVAAHDPIEREMITKAFAKHCKTVVETKDAEAKKPAPEVKPATDPNAPPVIKK